MSTCLNTCTLSWQNCQSSYQTNTATFYTVVNSYITSASTVQPLPVSLLSHISLAKLEGTWNELYRIGSVGSAGTNKIIYTFQNNGCGLNASIKIIEPVSCSNISTYTGTFSSIDQSNINFVARTTDPTIVTPIAIILLDYKVLDNGEKIAIISSIDRLYFSILSNKICVEPCLIEKIICFAKKFGWILADDTKAFASPYYFNCTCVPCPPQPCPPPPCPQQQCHPLLYPQQPYPQQLWIPQPCTQYNPCEYCKKYKNY